jgi:hypothetical protein
MSFVADLAYINPLPSMSTLSDKGMIIKPNE